jgi:hypothetical protein
MLDRKFTHYSLFVLGAHGYHHKALICVRFEYHITFAAHNWFLFLMVVINHDSLDGSR